MHVGRVGLHTPTHVQTHTEHTHVRTQAYTHTHTHTHTHTPHHTHTHTQTHTQTHTHACAHTQTHTHTHTHTHTGSHLTRPTGLMLTCQTYPTFLWLHLYCFYAISIMLCSIFPEQKKFKCLKILKCSISLAINDL